MAGAGQPGGPVSLQICAEMATLLSVHPYLPSKFCLFENADVFLEKRGRIMRMMREMAVNIK
jgi:hypothetical protein